MQKIKRFLSNSVYVISVLFLLWFSCSFIEVTAHNNNGKYAGSDYNLFKLLIENFGGEE